MVKQKLAIPLCPNIQDRRQLFKGLYGQVLQAINDLFICFTWVSKMSSFVAIKCFDVTRRITFFQSCFLIMRSLSAGGN